jgi:phytoene dehydrogenase-like protein
MASFDYDAIVVGGGHNGLVTAGYLARAGLTVLVVERRPFVGGACVTEELFPGCHFNTCAQGTSSLVPKIIRDLDLPMHGLARFIQPDPALFRPFPDGRHLFFWRNEERTVAEIRRHSPRDAEVYPRWLRFWERVLAIIEPFVLHEPPTLAELFRSVQGTDEEALLEKVVTTSRADLLDASFELDILKGCLVTSGDTGDPRAVGSAIPYMTYAVPKIGDATDELYTGIPPGGVGAITRALARSAASHGATIQTNVEVTGILVAGGRARGVRLADGTEITSRVVVSNADPKRTLLNLVGAEHLDAAFADRVRHLRTKVAYLKFHAVLSELPDFSRYLGTSYDPRLVCRFYINPSVESYEQAWLDAVNGRPSRRPLLSVQIMSIYDPTLAPPGRHVVSIFGQYAPVRPSEGTWDDWRERVGENMIDLVTEYAPNFRRAIVGWVAETPLDLERRVYLTNGNIHHVDLIPSQMLAHRPLDGWSHYATPIRDLWLCGAGTHPGGEVSGAPGHNAAHAIIKHLNGGT